MMWLFLIFSCDSDSLKGVDTGQDLVNTDESAIQECVDFVQHPESQFIGRNQPNTDTIPPCSEVWHAFAGAKNSTLELKLTGEPNIDVRVETLLGDPLDDWVSVGSTSTIQVDLVQSGELFVVLKNSEPKSVDYGVEVSCLLGCEFEFTRHPLVFMHGLAGFETLLNVLDYWKGVEELLIPTGFNVQIHAVAAFDDTYTRSVMWMEHFDAMRSAGVGRRFNLIGHSQGGLDARYFTSILDTESQIASITTVATPHHGSSIAGLFDNAIDLSPADGAVLDALVSGAAELFGSTGDSLSNQLSQMTPESMVAFNQSAPDVSGVQYFSWAGRSCRYLQLQCQADMSGETVSSYLLLSHGYVENREGSNDGLVSVESARWGNFLGVLPADHLDEVGYRYDLSNQPFDSAQFYLSEARRLSQLGL